MYYREAQALKVYTFQCWKIYKIDNFNENVY